MNTRERFIKLQGILLGHNYRYYILNEPTISDGEYDKLKEESFSLANELGFRADKDKGAGYYEQKHVHWDVGFNENNYFWYTLKMSKEDLKPKQLKDKT